MHRGVPAAGAASHVQKYGVDWRGCRSGLVDDLWKLEEGLEAGAFSKDTSPVEQPLTMAQNKHFVPRNIIVIMLITRH